MLLEVAELAVDVATRRGLQRVVDRTSFSLDEGESLGVVGESGSGKTMTALALMGSDAGGRAASRVRSASRGGSSSASTKTRCAQLRGDRIAMIFQEPMTALNPLRRVGAQVAEPLMLHRGLEQARGAARARSSCSSACGWPSRSARRDPIRSRSRAASGSAR